jgi:uncharacterized protein
MPGSYEKNILNFRKEKDQKIQADHLHWMNLVGLFWLEEGENTFGNDENNKIFHPSFPKPYCGSFFLEKNQVRFQPAKGVPYTSDNPGLENRAVIVDRDSNPDMIHIGSLTMKILIRGGSLLVRMWDRESLVKAQFKGLKYYPIKEEYKVPAKYIPHPSPKRVKKAETIGTETEVVFLGYIQFRFYNMDCRIEVEDSGDKLLLHFADGTNGKTTYGGGRRIYLTTPETTDFILDLNRTENWPCAYSDYSTCPLVPPQNRLPISIEAGELKYKD